MLANKKGSNIGSPQYPGDGNRKMKKGKFIFLAVLILQKRKKVKEETTLFRSLREGCEGAARRGAIHWALCRVKKSENFLPGSGVRRE